MLSRRVRLVGLTSLVLSVCLVPVATQPPPRRAATVAAVQSFPAFYHAQPVVVRGEVKVAGDRATISTLDATLPLLTRDSLPDEGTYEVRGEAFDVGRLSPEDPRLTSADLGRLGLDRTDRWPRHGELVVLRAASFDRPEPLAAPGIRGLALDPHRYEGQRVTVAGQFRGRNLYGDLPQAPSGASDSRHGFVLRSADAAVWVVGKEPKGRGFEFDSNSRIDTRRWLEVTGVVRQDRGLAWIEPGELQEVEPQRERPVDEVTQASPPVPPEVLFSVPAADEVDVPRDTRVRIQFSRDLDESTLKGRIRVTYLGAESMERGEPQAPAVVPDVEYDGGRRVLELTFGRPLERFRTVRVELLEGIAGTDGAPLTPWSLTFSVGG